MNTELVVDLFYRCCRGQRDAFEELQTVACAADQHLARAFVMRLYTYGSQLVEKNTRLARRLSRDVIDWALATANRPGPDRPFAEYIVGTCYAEGLSLPQDHREALRFYLRAAEAGFAPAQNNVGVCYSDGEGVEVDEAEALRWYRLAAEQQLPSAMDNYGDSLVEGEGCEKNVAEGFRWYERSAALGSLRSLNTLAQCYLDATHVARDFDRAVALLRRGEERDSALSLFLLSHCYQYGQGVAKDAARSLQLLQRSAERGDGDAQLRMGLYCLYGLSVADYLAGRWHQRLCFIEPHEPLAYFDAVPRDEAAGLRWLEIAARQGQEQALELLASYLLERGRPRDALPWLYRGVHARQPSCSLLLGSLHFHGIAAAHCFNRPPGGPDADDGGGDGDGDGDGGGGGGVDAEAAAPSPFGPSAALWREQQQPTYPPRSCRVPIGPVDAAEEAAEAARRDAEERRFAPTATAPLTRSEEVFEAVRFLQDALLQATARGEGDGDGDGGGDSGAVPPVALLERLAAHVFWLATQGDGVADVDVLSAPLPAADAAQSTDGTAPAALDVASLMAQLPVDEAPPDAAADADERSRREAQLIRDALRLHWDVERRCVVTLAAPLATCTDGDQLRRRRLSPAERAAVRAAPVATPRDAVALLRRVCRHLRQAAPGPLRVAAALNRKYDAGPLSRALLAEYLLLALQRSCVATGAQRGRHWRRWSRSLRNEARGLLDAAGDADADGGALLRLRGDGDARELRLHSDGGRGATPAALHRLAFFAVVAAAHDERRGDRRGARVHRRQALRLLLRAADALGHAAFLDDALLAAPLHQPRASDVPPAAGAVAGLVDVVAGREPVALELLVRSRTLDAASDGKHATAEALRLRYALLRRAAALAERQRRLLRHRLAPGDEPPPAAVSAALCGGPEATPLLDRGHCEADALLQLAQALRALAAAPVSNAAAALPKAPSQAAADAVGVSALRWQLGDLFDEGDEAAAALADEAQLEAFRERCRRSCRLLLRRAAALGSLDAAQLVGRLLRYGDRGFFDEAAGGAAPLSARRFRTAASDAFDAAAARGDVASMLQLARDAERLLGGGGGGAAAAAASDASTVARGLRWAAAAATLGAPGAAQLLERLRQLQRPS